MEVERARITRLSVCALSKDRLKERKSACLVVYYLLDGGSIAVRELARHVLSLVSSGCLYHRALKTFPAQSEILYCVTCFGISSAPRLQALKLGHPVRQAFL